MEKLAEKLAKLGIKRDMDFALHLPIRYEDETKLIAIGNLVSDELQQAEGVVTKLDIVYRPRKKIVIHLRGDDDAMLLLLFLNFHSSYFKKILVGQRIRARGIVKKKLCSRDGASNLPYS